MKKQIRTSNFIGPVIRICILIVFTVCVYLGTKIKNNYKDSASSIPAPTDVSATEESIFEDSFLEEESCKVPTVSKDPYVQLETIFNQSDVWKLDNGYFDYGEGVDFEDWDYAITDFDCDGNLEVLVTGWAGTGHFSISRIFEYESENSLSEWDMDGLSIGNLEPDFILQSCILSKFDEPDTITKISDAPEYIALDKEWYGADGGQISYIKFKVDDNSFSSELIAYYKEDFPNDKTTFYDAEGKGISKKEFDNLINDAYEDETELKTFGWFNSLESVDSLNTSYDIWTGELNISHNNIDSSYIPKLVLNEEKEYHDDAYLYCIDGAAIDKSVTCDVTSMVYGYDESNYNGKITVTRKPRGDDYTEFIFYEDDKVLFNVNNKELYYGPSIEGIQFHDINGDGKDEILIKYYTWSTALEKWVYEAYIYTENDEGWQILMAYNIEYANANITKLLNDNGYEEAKIVDIYLEDNGVRLLLEQNFEKIDECWFNDSYEVVIK